MADRQTLLDSVGGDEFKPVALTAIRGWYDNSYLVTRDEARIHDIASKVILPEAQWASADFPEGIEHLTIWTEESVIVVHENHENGTSVVEVRRNPPSNADQEWEA